MYSSENTFICFRKSILNSFIRVCILFSVSATQKIAGKNLFIFFQPFFFLQQLFSALYVFKLSKYFLSKNQDLFNFHRKKHLVLSKRRKNIRVHKNNQPPFFSHQLVIWSAYFRWKYFIVKYCSSFYFPKITFLFYGHSSYGGGCICLEGKSK